MYFLITQRLLWDLKKELLFEGRRLRRFLAQGKNWLWLAHSVVETKRMKNFKISFMCLSWEIPPPQKKSLGDIMELYSRDRQGIREDVLVTLQMNSKMRKHHNETHIHSGDNTLMLVIVQWKTYSVRRQCSSACNSTMENIFIQETVL